LKIVDSLKIKNDSLNKILSGDIPESNYWCDVKYDGEKLSENGISNPRKFIKNSAKQISFKQ